MNAGSSRITTSHIDSPLGRWTSSHWSPPALNGVVEMLWYFDGTLTMPRERHFPNGMLEIIVHFGALYKSLEGGRMVESPTLCLSGITLEPSVVEGPGVACAVMGIRLHPTGAYALLAGKMALSETNGLSPDLRDLVGSAADALQEYCGRETTGEARLQAAVRWLMARLQPQRVHPAVRWMAAEIAGRQGAVSIGSLRDQIGLSKTRISQLFRQQVGVTPKHFARIHRFSHVLQLLTESGQDFSSAALAAGYFDQSHMNAEFRELALCSPGEFMAATRYPHGMSLAEG